MPAEEIGRISELAKLSFTAAELESFSKDFRKILDYVGKLRSVDVKGMEPFVWPRENPLEPRPDTPAAPCGSDAAIRNTAAKKGDYYIVPKVVQNE